MYLVMAVIKRTQVKVFGQIESDIVLSWADGQIGAIPVFENKEDALAYANGKEEMVKQVEAV